MDWNADHAGFVIAAYSVVIAVLLAVLLVTLNRSTRLKRSLKKLGLSDVGQSD